MTLRAKLSLLSVLLLLGLAFVALLTVRSNSAMGEALARADTLYEVRRTVFELNSLLDDYLRRPGERPLVQWRALYARLGDLLDTVERGQGEDHSALRELKRDSALLPQLFEQLRAAAAERGAGPRSERELLLEERLIRVTDSLTGTATRLVREVNQKLLAAQAGQVRQSLVLMGGLGLALALALLWLWRNFARRLAQLGEGARILGSGDLAHRLRIDSGDEIGQLGQAFNRMAGSLEAQAEILRRTNRALRTLSECNQALVRATSEPQLLQDICSRIVEHGGYRFAWVDYAEKDESKRVRPVAQAGFEDGYLDSLDLTWGDDEHGRGLTGTAIRTGEPCVVADMAGDPRFAPWREAALARGYASAVALPLVVESRAIGALSIYAAEPGAFHDEEMPLLLELAADLGFGIATLRNRAERDQVQAALRESEERLNFALRKSHTGGWDLDLVDHIAHRTLEHDRIFGYSSLLPQWTYEMFLEHVLPEDRADVDRCFREATAAQTEWSFECRIRRVDGEVRWILAAGEHQRGEAGQTRRMAGIVQDITERKRAEQEIRDLNASLERRVAERTQQLEASNKELESFSYSVSHDLRAPLRAIDGFSRIVLEDCAGKLDVEGRRLLGVIRDNSGKMGRLIDDLLEYSRLGRKSLSSAEIDIKRLVEEVFGELQASGEKPHRLVLAALPPARGDATLLKQVWTNLLVNAIKFSGKREQPVIEVSVNENGAENVYCVKDNGAGFDMRYYDKLFGVFQRLHREEEFEGTGVGLAIVQRIVSRHGGRVWAEGKVDEGAAFYFSLPKGRQDGQI